MDITLVACGSRPWEYWSGYWGLSYLVDGDILYDTFYDFYVLKRKLGKLGVSPSEISSIVISHEHSDHIGGIEILEEKQGASVYLPTSASQPIKDKIVSLKGRLVDAPGIKTLKENILISEEMIAARAKPKRPVAEQFLLANTSQGPVMLVGCSHPGILRMVRKAKETLGEPISGVIGGFHLMHTDAKSVHDCAEALKGEGVQIIAPTHCTGWRAERIFRRTFGDGFLSFREGQTLSL